MAYYLDRPGSYLVIENGASTDQEAVKKEFLNFVAAGYEYYILADKQELLYNPILRETLMKFREITKKSDPFGIYALQKFSLSQL